MKVAFLINNVYGIGGTIRSTVNLSSALAAADHDVEVASVYRTRDRPQLEVHPRVAMRPLIEWREDAPGYDGRDVAVADPSVMFQDEGVAFGPLAPTRLTDERVAAFLRETDADIVIATRPVLNGYLARFGQTRYLRVGQEHLTLDMHSEQLRADQNAALAELDAFVTVSEADAARYRAALPDVATRILCIPNGVPAPAVAPSDGASRTIVAAGRLIAIKRFDRLLDAFAKIAPRHPDWNLRLYGRGPSKAALRQRIEELGLHDRVRLMGAVSPIETEWAKGAIAAVSSDGESFGMTIVEAMHCGVPVVATDCPHGPGEIITDGSDGLLVPLAGGADAYADALASLMRDSERRTAMGAAARRKARTYRPAHIAERYVGLFDSLRGPGRSPRAMARKLRDAVRPLLSDRGRPTAAPPGDRAPRARAATGADGGLVVRLDREGMPDERLDLLLRLRGDTAKRQLRVPLSGSGRAEVERSEHTLVEGRWDAYVVPRGTSRGGRRISAALVEQARLLTLPLRVGEDVSAWIPYTTNEGNLTLRAWSRPAHAEVEDIHVAGETAHVTAVLYGAEISREAKVVLASRTGGGADVTVAALPRRGNRLSFTMPYRKAVARCAHDHELWDVRLLDTPGGEPIPLGRIAGDIVDRKTTDLVPAVVLDHPERGATRVRPYFTVHNDLALSARQVPAAS